MRKQRIFALAALFLMAVFALGVRAQSECPRKGGDRDSMSRPQRPFGKDFRYQLMTIFYPIWMVKHHAEEIKLTSAQEQKLRKLSDETHAEIDKMEEDVDRESKVLVELIKQNAAQKKILAQMDKLFVYENAIKKKHTTMMIAIRNVLTAKQREILDKIKEEHMSHRGKHHRGGPPWDKGDRPPGPPPGGGGPSDVFLYMGN